MENFKKGFKCGIRIFVRYFGILNFIVGIIFDILK